MKFPSIDGYCKRMGYPTHIFFPDNDHLGQIAYAKVICNLCDASDLCLQIALDNDIEHGIWGGATEEERRTIKRRKVLRTYVSPSKTQHEQEHPAYERPSFLSGISASYNHSPSVSHSGFAQRLVCYGSYIEVSTLQSPEVLSSGPNQKSLVSRVLDEFESFQRQLSQLPGYNPATQLKTGRQLFQGFVEQSSSSLRQNEPQPNQLSFQDQSPEASLDFSNIFDEPFGLLKAKDENPAQNIDKDKDKEMTQLFEINFTIEH